MKNRHEIRYEKLIQYFLDNPITEGYLERHHIIPQCIGGTNDKSNLIYLPSRVHFLAHYFLYIKQILKIKN